MATPLKNLNTQNINQIYSNFITSIHNIFYDPSPFLNPSFSFLLLPRAIEPFCGLEPLTKRQVQIPPLYLQTKLYDPSPPYCSLNALTHKWSRL